MQQTNNVSELINTKPWLLHSRFEQGRGNSGVPKCFIAIYSGAVPDDGGEKSFSIETCIKLVVSHMRIVCADPVMHGSDIMPPNDSEYELHHVAGGKIDEPSKFRWQQRSDGMTVCETVLTWGTPGRHLLKLVNQLEKESSQ